MLLCESDARSIYSKYFNFRQTTTSTIRTYSPFRKERNASFELNLSNGLWYDYGSGEGGDVIKFISTIENISIKDSFLRYADIMNGGVIELTKPILSYAARNKHSIDLRVYTKEYLNNIHDWDSSILEDRGIDECTFRRNNGTMWNQGGAINVLISYNGSSSEIIDHYKMFTYKDSKKYVYSRGNVTLYPSVSLRQRNIVLCEGEYDCLSLLSLGYNAITGTGGAGTFKDEWEWALSGKRIFIVYDNDDAGIRGSLMVHSRLNDWCKFVKTYEWDTSLPNHYDVGDHIKAKKSFDDIIKFK